MKHTLLLIAGLALASLTGALHAQQPQNILTQVELWEAKKAQAVIQVKAADDAYGAALKKLDEMQVALSDATAAAAKLDPPGTVDPALQEAVTAQKAEALKLQAAALKIYGSAEYKYTDRWTPRLGEGWRDVWRNSTLANPNNHLVDFYIAGKEFYLFPGEDVNVLGLSVPKKQEWLAHIGKKPTLSVYDFATVWTLRTYHPATAARGAEFAEFMPSGAIRGETYYEFYVVALQARGFTGGKWQNAMQADEWLDLVMANAHFSTTTFAIGRDKVSLRAARLLIKKRQAAKLPVEGKEFDAAFAPILTALKAPKFSGLRDACTALGIDMGLPAVIDWSTQEAVAAAVINAAERNGKFITAWGTEVPYADGLGSVMFVKGEAGYAAWRDEILDKD